MREPEMCSMKYCGYKKPRNLDEINFEILGLENLIKKVEERKTALKQSSFLAEKALEREHSALEEYFERDE